MQSLSHSATTCMHATLSLIVLSRQTCSPTALPDMSVHKLRMAGDHSANGTAASMRVAHTLPGPAVTSSTESFRDHFRIQRGQDSIFFWRAKGPPTCCVLRLVCILRRFTLIARSGLRHWRFAEAQHFGTTNERYGLLLLMVPPGCSAAYWPYIS